MRTYTLASICLLALITLATVTAAAAEKTPILYSTDLHHPPMDPDDHFDLATLFALDEFDIRGIILDCGSHQVKAPGEIPVRQLIHLTGKKVLYAVGLGAKLTSPDDDGRNQSSLLQGAVKMILDVLEQSPQKVTIFTTGSLRDVAAAYNREPELFRRKVARLYVNIGNPKLGKESRQYEYNVGLDTQAYLAIMRSDLPIYWCPCFDGAIWQRGDHGTYWKFTHKEVLDSTPVKLQNWFIYALTKQQGDPIEFLSAPQQAPVREKLWPMPRNMWCTAPFLHAAGRKVYLRGEADYIALNPTEAEKLGLKDKAVDAFGFVPMQATARSNPDGTVGVALKLDPAESGAYVFQNTTDDYGRILTSCLKHLLAGALP